MQDTQELILAELRELRTDYNTHARETGERLASLESKMKFLIGNGQPGRISIIETSLIRLQAWRWKIMGAAAGVSGLVSALGWVIVRLVH